MFHFYLNLTIRVGLELTQEELTTWLESAGYDKLPRLEDAKQFSVSGEVVDVWLPSGEGIRINFAFDKVERIRIYREQQPSDIAEFTFPLAEADVLMEKWKGNLVYYYGPRQKGGLHYCIVRGKGTKNKEAAAFLRARGFRYKLRSGHQRVYAYTANISVDDFRKTLKSLDRMGYQILASDVLTKDRYLF